MASERVNVLVAGGHGALREGLVRLLSHAGALDVVASVATIDEIARAAVAQPIDVAVFDLDLPGGAPAAAAALHAVWPRARFVVFGVDPAPAAVAEAVRAGVSGVAGVAAGSAELIALICRAAEGLANAATADSAPRLRGHGDASRCAALTDREREVVALIAQGYSNAGVAAATGLSEHTVRAHLRSVARKLGVRNRAHAVSAALRSGQIALGKAS